ncbi:MAG: ATP-binding protein [Nanoarchaeota archaeon]
MVNKEFWLEKVQNWHEKRFPKILERSIDIPNKIKISRMISLIGPRRTGKTYELLFIAKRISEKYNKENTLYINFESPEFGVLDAKDLIEMLKAKRELFPDIPLDKLWLFLDEIQNVNNWEKFVRKCLDDGINVFVSGSSSRFLSKEIATSMRGRNLSYYIYPLSFNEFLYFKGFDASGAYSTQKKSKILKYLREYLTFGGYPEVVLFSFEKERILNDIFNTAILRDVIERNNIRNDFLLRSLIKALLTSKEFSVNKFYNYLKSQGIKVSKDSVYKYLTYLEDAFFVFSLNKFSLSYKKAEQSIPKIFFVDNGLLYNNGVDDLGRLMENLVFVELKRRNKEISYYKNSFNKEVDFVVKKGKKIKQLIQVCYNLEDYNTLEREVSSLISVAKEFKCNNLLLISWSEEKKIKRKSLEIKFIPLWKWLLE